MTPHRARARGRATVLLAVAAATCTVTTASAQSPFGGAATSTIPWPAASGAPTRAVVGDFTGDLVADAVFLSADGGATLVYGPGVYSAFVPLAPDVRDAARLPAEAAGSADRLLVLDDVGLRMLSGYDAGSFTVTTLGAGAPWDTAVRLVTGDVTGDGRIDAVGVAADGRTILVASNVGSGASAPASFTLQDDVLDLVIAAWFPAPAIAILTDDGLSVRTAGGSPVVDYLGGAIASGALVGFSESTLAHERIAVVYTLPTGVDYLAVVDSGGPVQNSPLGSIGAYALASGDVDGDALDDLVVLHHANHFAMSLRNRGGSGAPFVSVDWVDCGLGSAPAPAQTGFPVLADLTNDGDLDLLVHVAAATQLVAIENTSKLHTSLSPVVHAGHYAYSFAAHQGELFLEVLPSTSTHTFAAEGIEVVLWAQDGSGTSASALQHTVFAVEADGKAYASLTIEEDDVATSKTYHLEMRGVRLGAGAPLQVGPAAVWAFATPAEDVQVLELEYGTEGVALRIFLVDEGRFMTSAEADERILTPSSVPIPKVPPIDEPPDPFDD